MEGILIEYRPVPLCNILGCGGCSGEIIMPGILAWVCDHNRGRLCFVAQVRATEYYRVLLGKEVQGSGMPRCSFKSPGVLSGTGPERPGCCLHREFPTSSAQGRTETSTVLCVCTLSSKVSATPPSPTPKSEGNKRPWAYLVSVVRASVQIAPPRGPLRSSCHG